MAINFPASPTLNQTFTSGNVNYVWDGTKWTASVTGGIALDKITEGNTSAEVVDTGSDGRFVVTTEGVEALRVDNQQRVGIGTATPTTITAGNTNLTLGPGSSGSQGSEIHMESATHSGSGNGANISYIGSDLYLVNREAGVLSLYTNATERARISSTGALGLSGANYGTSGQVLTSQGSGAAPQWATPAGGAWTFISSATASNSASIAFTSGIDSTYDVYMFTYTLVFSTSNDVHLRVRFSSNGGSSYISGSFDYRQTRIDYSSISVGYGSGGAINIGTMDTVAADYGAPDGIFYLFSPSSSQRTGYVQFGQGGRGDGYMIQNGGRCEQKTSVNAVQFFGSAGNLASGTFRLYGLKNS